jgi:hypothetical protein
MEVSGIPEAATPPKQPTAARSFWYCAM